tara:strand:+ start:1347 stop:1760 length:414 start_codon:yes stop_codon:yes gene_type:complete
MIINKNNYNEEIISAACLLLSISNADEKIDNTEINLIKNILIDFFKIDKIEIHDLIQISLDVFKKSTDIYEFGRILNNSFSYEDKIDFICCAFEVAYADKNLHYFEEHLIKTIGNILKVKHNDLIEAKSEIKKFINL